MNNNTETNPTLKLCRDLLWYIPFSTKGANMTGDEAKEIVRKLFDDEIVDEALNQLLQKKW